MAPTPVFLSNSKAFNQAAILLSEWEQARPANSAVVTSELRTAFIQFVGAVLNDTQETNLDIADVQKGLHRAAGLAIGRGEASGPGRANRALLQAYRSTQSVGPSAAVQGQLLLLLQARPDAELEMEELTEITETMGRDTGSEWEIIFGYGVVPDLPAEIRFAFLSAPSTAT